MSRVILPLFAVVFLLTATQVEDEAPPPDSPIEPAAQGARGSVADQLRRALAWSRSVNAGVFAVALKVVADGPSEAAQRTGLTAIGEGLRWLAARSAAVVTWTRSDEAIRARLDAAVGDLGRPPASPGR